MVRKISNKALGVLKSEENTRVFMRKRANTPEPTKAAAPKPEKVIKAKDYSTEVLASNERVLRALKAMPRSIPPKPPIDNIRIENIDRDKHGRIASMDFKAGSGEGTVRTIHVTHIERSEERRIVSANLSIN